MKFYALSGQAETADILAPDYQAAREIGVVRLGESRLYFRKLYKVYYISYKEIRRCFRRVMLVPAKLCCGKGDLQVEHLVICGDTGELAQIQLPGERAGKALLEELKKLVPEARFTRPDADHGVGSISAP